MPEALARVGSKTSRQSRTSNRTGNAKGRTSRGSSRTRSVHWSFEVVKAEVAGWPGVQWKEGEQQEEQPMGIFLEIYLASTAARHGPCYCPQIGRPSKILKKRRTDLAAEDIDMEWTRYDDNDKETEPRQVPLFTLGCNTSVEELHLVVDIYRKILPIEGGSQHPGRATRVCRMHGSCDSSELGEVILEPTRRDMKLFAASASELNIEGEQIIPKAKLTLRLASSRMFTLENARPSRLGELSKHSLQPHLRNQNARAASKQAFRFREADSDSEGSEGAGTGSKSVDLPQRRTSLMSVASTSRTALQRHATDLHFDWVPRKLQSMWEMVWPHEDDDLEGQYEVLPLMEAEFRRDCVVFFNTLFPRVHGSKFMTLRDAALERTSAIAFPRVQGNSDSDAAPRLGGTISGVVHDDYSPRIMFLKRLFICFAVCGVKYFEDRPGRKDTEKERMWAFPLAAILGHGSRILIRLEDVSCSEFLNFLLCGDPNAVDWKESGVPLPLERRMAATHAVDLVDCPDEDIGGGAKLVERRLSVMSLPDTLQNVSDGLKKKHLGLNLPIGGVGSATALNSRKCVVGFNGVILRPVQVGDPSLKRKGSKRSIATHSSLSNASAEDDDEATNQSSRDNLRQVVVRKTRSLFGGDSLGLSNLARGRDRGENPDGGDIAISVTVTPEGAKKFLQPPVPGTRWNNNGHNNGGSFESFTEQDESVGAEPHTPGSAALSPMTPDATSMTRVKSGKTEVSCKTEASLKQQNRMERKPSNLSEQSHDEMPEDSNEALLFSAKQTQESRSTRHFGSERSRPKRSVLWDWVPLPTLQSGHMYIRADDFGERPTSWEKARGVVDSREAIRRSLFKLVDKQQVPLHQASIRRALDLNASAAGELLFCKAVPLVKRASMASPMDLPKAPGDTMTMKRVQSMPSRLTASTTASRRNPSVSSSTWTGNGGTEDGGSNMLAQQSGLLDFELSEMQLPQVQKLSLQVGRDSSECHPTLEMWARHAIFKGGPLPPPPALGALRRLLALCGLDINRFGQGGMGTLHDLWHDLIPPPLETEDHATIRDIPPSRLVIDGKWPVQVVERVVLRLKRLAPKQQNNGSPGRERVFQVIVQEHSPKPELRWEAAEQSLPSRRLPAERVGWHEDWRDAAMRCAEACLRYITGKPKEKVRDLLSAPTRVYHEVRRSASSARQFPGDHVYPGIQTFERYHLVTYSVRYDGGGSNHSASSTIIASPLSPKLPVSCDKLMWVGETEMEGVEGARLWQEARSDQTHNLSSVLLGLEGSAPGCESPFGMSHDATGASSKVSAVGNRKWRAYKINCARDVPNEVDGMRMTLTRATFEEFVKTCDLIRLIEASSDLDPSKSFGSGGSTAWQRDALEERFMEQEFFRHILGGSMQEARRAVEWMKEYRSTRRRSTDNAEHTCASCSTAYVRHSILLPKEQLRAAHEIANDDLPSQEHAVTKSSFSNITLPQSKVDSRCDSRGSLGSIPTEMLVKIKDSIRIPAPSLGFNLPSLLPRWNSSPPSSPSGSTSGGRPSSGAEHVGDSGQATAAPERPST